MFFFFWSREIGFENGSLVYFSTERVYIYFLESNAETRRIIFMPWKILPDEAWSDLYLHTQGFHSSFRSKCYLNLYTSYIMTISYAFHCKFRFEFFLIVLFAGIEIFL